MPRFEVQMQGRTFEVEAPTQEDAISAISAQQPQPDVAPQNIALSDVPGKALANLPESARQFGSNLIAPIMHPIDTAQGIMNVGLGAAQKLIPGEQSSEKYADAVGEFFAERYGGWENVKRTMATDPVGFMADVATVLTGGGAAGARVPGMAGQVAKTASKVGRAVDPTNVLAKTGSVGAELLGATTGTSGESIRIARGAGRQGGEAAETFQSAMQGRMPVEAPVRAANEAATNMRLKRGSIYTQQMEALGKSPETVSFDKVQAAYRKALDDFKGSRDILPKKAVKAKEQIDDAFNRFAELGDEFSPVDLDILKQDLWDIQSKYLTKKDSRYTLANNVRRAVKDAILDAAPEYKKIMGDYSEASDVIREIETTLLSGKTVDSQLRKLQSIMRNNANTNYGYRFKLGEILSENGATNLMEMLAGQSLSAWAPRGIGRGGLGVTVGGAAAFNPLMAAGVPFQMPRVVGSAAYGLGAAQRYGRSAMDAARIPEMNMSPALLGLPAFQAGRITEIEER